MYYNSLIYYQLRLNHTLKRDKMDAFFQDKLDKYKYLEISEILYFENNYFQNTFNNMYESVSLLNPHGYILYSTEFQFICFIYPFFN